MTKEFLPYDRSLKLKQLGFDEPCLGFYERNQELIIQECLITDFHGDSLQCVAPTYSQAFIWFDCSTEYSGFIVPSPKVGLFTWWIQNYTELQLSIESEESYSTREEAELACLDKLIEIVELKDQEQ